MIQQSSRSMRRFNPQIVNQRRSTDGRSQQFANYHFATPARLPLLGMLRPRTLLAAALFIGTFALMGRAVWANNSAGDVVPVSNLSSQPTGLVVSAQLPIATIPASPAGQRRVTLRTLDRPVKVAQGPHIRRSGRYAVPTRRMSGRPTSSSSSGKPAPISVGTLPERKANAHASTARSGHRPYSGMAGQRLAAMSVAGATTILQRRQLLPPVTPAGDAQRGALLPNPGARILAAPSVSVDVIRAQLRSAESPLLTNVWTFQKDAAQYIWDAGYVMGVDPAILMAFFWHESHYGTQGMASQTYSVGNIRPLSGQPELNGYRFYRTWAEGVDDAYRLLRDYALHGAPDVTTAIPTWAPAADNNDEAAYIADVQQKALSLYTQSTSIDATAPVVSPNSPVVQVASQP